MNFTVSGIPMAMIPHPQGPWLEGITPVTNLQWRSGVERLMNEGAKYCLVETHHLGDFVARQLGDFKDVLDTIGRDNVPRGWRGKGVLIKRIGLQHGISFLFKWRPKMSRPGFDGDHQPVVDVNWYQAKGWTLAQGGLYLLTNAQWEWSSQYGLELLELTDDDYYSTESGKLFNPEGKKLAHCSVGTKERSTIDVNDPRYVDGPSGLRHKTGNVDEWVERTFLDQEDRDRGGHPYTVRGGSWRADDEGLGLNPFFNRSIDPYYSDCDIGFRVGAPAPKSKDRA